MMKKHNIIQLFILIVIMGACNTPPRQNTVSKVELKQNELNQWRIYVDGAEFFVKGAGCEGGDVAALAADGGNSFRTWMDQEIRPTEQSVLDNAQQHGLKVLMGLEAGKRKAWL